LSQAVEDNDPRVELLTDIRDILTETTDDVLSSEVLVQELTSRKDRPWYTWRNGKPLSERGVATLLKPLKIWPDRQQSAAGRRRGYRRDSFEEAISRYLPSAHVSMCPNNSSIGPDSSKLICPGAVGWDTNGAADQAGRERCEDAWTGVPGDKAHEQADLPPMGISLGAWQRHRDRKAFGE
jgi:hypothetical protein